MANSATFKINKDGYFNCCGIDVMAFSDFYPAGHQSGVTLIMNGKRLAANGDIRFEQTPGQWQPVPRVVERKVNEDDNSIVTKLEYPDMEAHLHGFNPIIYPDFEFGYEVKVKGLENAVEVTVDLDRPVAEEFLGKLCFNLELFPGEMFGNSWIMDGVPGIFPRQANAPTRKQKTNYDHSGKMRPRDYAHADFDKLTGKNTGYNPIIADDIIAEPYAKGHKLIICAEDDLKKFIVESETEELKIYDGRMNHNNGWFVISTELPANKTKGALKWIIKPTIDENWIAPAVVQLSQVGYYPAQHKEVVIELDRRDKNRAKIELQIMTEDGWKTEKSETASDWGHFLRYNYLTMDFSEVTKEGLYRVVYGESSSSIFRIAGDIYERGVWQPVLEYFLPVQMCHMRVNEKYRVWHGRCHMDDACMAPVNYEQFDGAAQGPETMTKYNPGDHVPGLNAGGWHDAGDFDLRIESQTGEMYNLASAYEEFDVFFDETTIDQNSHTVEIHQPDGKNDILQQVEHGALSVVGGYRSMGRLYHEVMCGDLRQYVLLGDAVNMTSGVADNTDERLVFTEDNPVREFTTAAHLAGTYRALKDLNEELAKECLDIAEEIFDITKEHSAECVKNAYDPESKDVDKVIDSKIHAACELFLSTKADKYKNYLINNTEYIKTNIKNVSWMICRCVHELKDEQFLTTIKEALETVVEFMEEESVLTPYGIPYRPNIWGAGWAIQSLAARYYFLYKAFPNMFDTKFMSRSLDFILGCHPGSNTESFASGVGTKSVTTAYGVNRADWSYIPGGVISGTALIRPDFPELLDFPYLWQQKEYVLGGGSSDYMFLVLAVRHIMMKDCV